jgi:hypothetical protein
MSCSIRGVPGTCGKRLQGIGTAALYGEEGRGGEERHQDTPDPHLEA